MSERQHLPLQFEKNRSFKSEDHFHLSKAINPLKLIEKKTDYLSISKKQKPEDHSGNFFSDHLKLEESQEKSKKIKKSSKFANYKTSMCSHGLDCLKRFSCNFAHSQHQLRKPFMNRTKPCILYQKGLCHLGSACREYHGNMDLKKKYKYQMEPCQDFIDGKCLKGDICIYLHQNLNQARQVVEEDLVKCDDAQVTNNEKEGICIESPVIEPKQRITVNEVVEKLELDEKILEGGLTFDFI